MKVRSLIYDDNFVINNPNIINELISLKEPIPRNINDAISEHYPNIHKQRLLLFGDDYKFMNQVRKERFVARELGVIESREYHNDLALEFIDKHPEFAPIIKEVKYIDV